MKAAKRAMSASSGAESVWRSRAGVAVLVGIGLACGPSAPARDEPPNVLLYIADTLRADGLGCYGNQVVQTPQLDRFAAEGVLFERAYSPSSWTRASIASILTGTAPAVHAAEGRYDLLTAPAVLISELFAAAGYRVGSITTNRNVGSFFGFDQGFAAGDFIELYEPSRAERVRVEELTTLADDVTARAIAWLSAADEPFCLVVHTIDPHSPYTPPEAWDRYGEGLASEVDGSQQALFQLKTERSPADEARVRSLYYGEIAFNDDAFGQLVDWMRERGSYDRTIFAFTSDHGEEFWEHGERGHGMSLYEEALHVPLILRYPPELARGARDSRLVSTLDLLPTLLDLAGLEPPPQVEGRSLAGSTSEPEALVFSSCKLSGVELYSVQNSDWKLVFDAKNGKKRLFDRSAAGAEQRDVFKQHREVGRELFRALEESLRAETEQRVALYGKREATRVDALSEEVEGDLRDLGYLGDPDDDPAEDDE